MDRDDHFILRTGLLKILTGDPWPIFKKNMPKYTIFKQVVK